MEDPVYAYRGVRRNGSTVVGRTLVRPVVFVEAAFDQRFRSLEVYRNALDCGECVGRVVTAPESGKRTWWAEK